MKKYILTVAALACACVMAHAQAVQPSLMVMPSAQWCNQHGFGQTITKENGREKFLVDYQKALLNSSDLKGVIAEIGMVMQDRGFMLKDLESYLQSQEIDEAFNSAGDIDLEMDGQDMILASAGPDIALEVEYSIQTLGPRKTLEYKLTAKDAYTNKQVATTGIQNYGPVVSTIPTSGLIKAAIQGSIDRFNEQLAQHFEDMRDNGREVSVQILTASGWEDGLETEVEGEELSDIVDEYFRDACVNGRYHKQAGSKNRIIYDAIRMPLFNDKEQGIQAEDWLKKGIRKALRAKGIPCKVKMMGLGKAQLIIGE